MFESFGWARLSDSDADLREKVRAVVREQIESQYGMATRQKVKRQLLDHEARHSRQYALFLGLPYLPLYTLAMGWSVLRTGDRASANVFERGHRLRLGVHPYFPVVGVAGFGQPQRNGQLLGAGDGLQRDG